MDGTRFNRLHDISIKYRMPPVSTPPRTDLVNVVHKATAQRADDSLLDITDHYYCHLSIVLPPGAPNQVIAYSVTPWSIITVPAEDLTSSKTSVILEPGGEIIAPVSSVPFATKARKNKTREPAFRDMTLVWKEILKGIPSFNGETEYRYDYQFPVERGRIPRPMPPKVYYIPPGSTIRNKDDDADALITVVFPFGALLVAHGDIASGPPPGTIATAASSSELQPHTGPAPK